jgi:hypothetical protein
MPNDILLASLARIGAKAQLDAILEAFPDLAHGATSAPQAEAPLPLTRTRTMSTAQRQAVSRRMRAYWKARKANGR